jgi:ATP-dependent helicase HrpB
LDEFHERSIHIDLALAMLREVQQTVRPDLTIIVMSATLDAEPVSQFLGGAPVVRVPGRLFPIDVRYRPAARDRYLDEIVVDALHVELTNSNTDDGDILVFLPGAGEINRAQSQLARLAAEYDLNILPLHGSLPNDQQLRALQPSDRRKVILATNIAETSLTIDGVTCVIDTGLHRRAGYDARRGMDTLSLTRISQASATQRAGRAGRTRPGRAIRLWSEKEHHALERFDAPEISRVDLATIILSLHAWGADDPRAFNFFHPPPEHMTAAAERLLAMLGALDAPSRGRITPLGRQLLSVPAHPRIARLLLAASEFVSIEVGATIAALLSEKDILRDAAPAAARRSAVPTTLVLCDVCHRLALLQSTARDDRLDFAAVQSVRRAAEQYQRSIRSIDRQSTNRSARPQDDSGIRKLILLSYPDRVCRMRDREKRSGVMVGGVGVKLAAESGVVDADLFVAVDARHNPDAPRAESTVRIATSIEPAWLEELFPQTVSRRTAAEFDTQRQRVLGVSRVMFDDLMIEEQANAPVDAETAAAVLAEALAPRANEIISQDESAAGFLARLDLLRRHFPDQPWPSLDGPAAVEILTDACRGKRAAAEVDSAALLGAIRNRLVYPLDRLLDQHAPETIAVPTGNRIRLSYAIGQPPKLAVRLQELFGLPATPRICDGRVAVVLELLGPNYRPVQVTDDLASFWKNTYAQVRKDLRARYPKHSWPEDPLTAPPQAKGSRRRT